MGSAVRLRRSSCPAPLVRVVVGEKKGWERSARAWTAPLPTALISIAGDVRVSSSGSGWSVDGEAAARRAAATRGCGLRTAGERRADGDDDEVVEFRDELREIVLIAGDSRDFV